MQWNHNAELNWVCAFAVEFQVVNLVINIIKINVRSTEKCFCDKLGDETYTHNAE